MISNDAEASVFRGASGSRAASWFRYPWRPGHASIGTILAGASSGFPTRLGERVVFFGRHASAQVFKPGNGKSRDLVFSVPPELSCERALLCRTLRHALLTQKRLAPPNDRGTAVVGPSVLSVVLARLLNLNGHEVRLFSNAGPAAHAAALLGIPVSSMTGDGATMPQRFGLVVVTTAGAASLEAAARLCAPAGHLVLLRRLSGDPKQSAMAAWQTVHKRSLSVSAFNEWAPGFASEPSASVMKEALALAMDASQPWECLFSHRVEPGSMPDLYQTMDVDDEAFGGVMVDWRLGG